MMREGGIVGGYKVLSTHPDGVWDVDGVGYTGGQADGMKDVEVIGIPAGAENVVYCLRKAVQRFDESRCKDPKKLVVKDPVPVRVACPFEDKDCLGMVSNVHKLIIIETVLSRSTIANVTAKTDNLLGTTRAMPAYVFGQIKQMVADDERRGNIKFKSSQAKVMYHWALSVYWLGQLLQRLIETPCIVVEHNFASSALNEPTALSRLGYFKYIYIYIYIHSYSHNNQY